MNSGIAVFDSSVLIIFHQVGYLDLLRELFDRIVVPTAVAEDVAPSLGELPPWIAERQVLSSRNLPPALDRGERAAIALAMDLDAEFVVLADLADRRAATTYGFTVIG